MSKLFQLVAATSIMLSIAFVPNAMNDIRASFISREKTELSASSSTNREIILRRSGQHFMLNRFLGKAEFGSTATLVTSLENADVESVSEWLSDEKRVAFAVWDEKMIQDMGNNIYKLKLMPLQFVTIKLAPEVDNRMWTEVDNNGKPVFKLQSIDFDPNIQVLPGLNVPASYFGIDIEVVGELRPSRNGSGVEGKIGFLSSGSLTPPMRLLPEPVLKSASNIICKTISDFAIRSFQQGARTKYREFKNIKQTTTHDQQNDK